MSGGSYNYAYRTVRRFADDLYRKKEEQRRASFAIILDLVANAMRDIEWVDSGDYGEGDEHRAIDKVFSFLKGEVESRPLLPMELSGEIIVDKRVPPGTGYILDMSTKQEVGR